AAAFGGDGGHALSGAWADGTGGDATGGYTASGYGGAGGAGGQAFNGDGGTGGDAGMWGSQNGDDGYVTGTSHSSADGLIDVSAFNQQIVMGANLQENLVDQTVVGGDYHNTLTGEDAGDHTGT
ncbi:MAG: hypothetical protein E5X24_27945, partial [Mesorhizobium sp.]